MKNPVPDNLGSALGRGFLLLFASLGILYFAVPAKLLPLIVGALVLIHFLPQHRNLIFFLANLLFWLASPIAWALLPQIQLLRPLTQSTASFFFLVLASNVLFFFLGYWLTRKGGKARMVLILGIFLVLQSLSLVRTEQPSFLIDLSRWAIVFYRSYFLYWLFILVYQPKGEGVRRNLLLSSFPFWSMASPISFVPVYPWASGPIEKPPTRIELTDSQGAGLRLLVLSALALLAHLLLQQTVLGMETKLPALPSLSLGSLHQGFELALQLHDTWWKRWLALVTEFLVIYLWIAYNLGITVAIARLAGFPLPATFQSPWKADSLLNFYGRLLFYYNRVLMHIFYPLFKPLFSGISNRRARVLLGVWSAIFLGGFFFHFGQDHFWHSSQGLGEAAFSHVRSLSYFLALATFISASLLFRRKDNRPRPLALLLLYLLVWSLVFSLALATRHTNSSWESYLAYMKGLLPLGQ